MVILEGTNCRILCVLGCVAFSLAFSYQVQSQPLSDAVRMAVSSNPEVQIDANRRLATEERLKQARAGYLPKLDLSLGEGVEQSENISTRPGSSTLWRSEAGLTLSQMVYDGAGTRSEVQRQTANVKSAAFRVGATSEQIAQQAIEAYLDVLRQQERLALAQDNLVAHQRTYEQIKRRAEKGVTRKADLDQAESRLAFSKASVTSAETGLKNAESTYIKVVGETSNALSKPDMSSDFPKTLENALKIAKDHHPSLRAARSEVEAAQAQIRSAESQMLPRLDLEMGTTWDDNVDGINATSSDTYAILRMRYNLFRGNADSARIAESQLQTQVAVEDTNRILRLVEDNVRFSWNALESARDRLPRLQERANAAERARDHYSRQFSAGQRTLLDLLDSENELFSSRTAYVDEQYVDLFAHYRLLANMGQLLSSLGVSPREESRTEDKADSPTLQKN